MLLNPHRVFCVQHLTLRAFGPQTRTVQKSVSESTLFYMLLTGTLLLHDTVAEIGTGKLHNDCNLSSQSVTTSTFLSDVLGASFMLCLFFKGGYLQSWPKMFWRQRNGFCLLYFVVQCNK